MKRKYLIIALAVICALSLVLAACDTHEHTFNDLSWKYDDTHHWHPAKCEHTDETLDKAPHVLENNRCTVCAYEGAGFSWANSGTSSGTVSSEKVLPAVPDGKADKPSIQIHYYRANSAEYKSWGFWLWSKVGDESSANGNVQSSDTAPYYGWPLNYQDDDGAVALYSLEELGWVNGKDVMLGFIAKQQNGNWVKDDVSADRFWNVSKATLDANNYYHLYVISGVAQTFDNKQDFVYAVQQLQYGLSAEFTSETRLEIAAVSNVSKVAVYEGTTLLAQSNTTNTKSISYNFESGKKMSFDKDYTVKVTFAADSTERECEVSIMKLYNTAGFDEMYYYDGELGALYTQDATEFRVWSPISTKIVLNLYEKGNGGEAYKTAEMTKGEKGVFSVTVSGDLAAKYYTYTVYNTTYPTGKEIVDPYAKSAGLNGVRGQIVNFAETNPVGWDKVSYLKYDANELTVWETHVSDVTSSATWTGTEAYRHKFLGMIESGTTYTADGKTVKTGFDHIKELGVNAVQLVPIFDQASADEDNKAFNWGYNPLNYNVVEGGYATDATDGYVRIKELKQLVMAFNGADISVIMDVVYNHVNSAEGSNFDVLMPGYYFRYSASGSLLNGSGCGNETASDRAMYRKFMIDSVCFWAKEYKLGGFRFDLMGLHDLDTMNQLTAELKKINPSIIVYGEPWTAGSVGLLSTQTANQSNANLYQGYGQFNDQMRDALIAGGLKGASEKAWATGGAIGISDIVNGLQGFTGSNIKDLYKTVNYVTCHDNYTLYDRVIATGQFGVAASVFNGTIKLTAEQQATVKQMAMLANSVVFTSNGVNFMLAGEEFLRSKAAGGAVGDEIHNSYQSSYKVNELDYALKIKNADVFENYQKLIEFKQKFVKEFGLNSNDAVAASYKVTVLGDNKAVQIDITAKDGSSWRIVHANGLASDVTVDFGGYTLYLSTLGTPTLSASTAITPYQTVIAHK